MYAASKHAVEGLTKSVALYGVRVNAVAPVRSRRGCSAASPAGRTATPK
ncbi:hypothetical protein [Lichenihabitans psoromatis]